MKRCPQCHYYNNKDDLQCQKCSYIFNLKTKITKDIEKQEDDWPSEEWKDWNLM